VTQFKVRWDSDLHMVFPDRNEYFWPRSGGGVGKGPSKVETSLDYNQLMFVTEAAAARASIAVETPYVYYEPEVNDSHAGWSDIRITTKALLIDCELMQCAFQFRTYIPSGNFNKGLGTGHVSLEPALLWALKLSPSTYFQAELAEWIPVGGDNDYAGSILHYHFSLNQVLWHGGHDIKLIGTMEFQGYSFQDGAFSDPAFVDANGHPLFPVESSGTSYLSIGPGIRAVMCDRVDLGIGTQFNISDHNWFDQFYRVEFRWRF
jgi:hypothetical protein